MKAKIVVDCRENVLRDGICLFTGQPCSDYPKCGWKTVKEVLTP